MEKLIISICSLVCVALLTFFFGKILGPKLVNLISPSFNKLTNKINDAIMGAPDNSNKKLREIIEATSDSLAPACGQIFSDFGKQTKAPSESGILEILPSNVKTFFYTYSILSFDGQTNILDMSALRRVTHRGKSYIIIGFSEEEGIFFALDLNNCPSIVRLAIDDSEKIYSVEDEAPSFEHFIVLQHALHTAGA